MANVVINLFLEKRRCVLCHVLLLCIFVVMLSTFVTYNYNTNTTVTEQIKEMHVQVQVPPQEELKQEFVSIQNIQQHNETQQKQKQRLVIHVGPHKTGTTTIQTRLRHQMRDGILKKYKWYFLDRRCLRLPVTVS